MYRYSPLTGAVEPSPASGTNGANEQQMVESSSGAGGQPMTSANTSNEYGPYLDLELSLDEQQEEFESFLSR